MGPGLPLLLVHGVVGGCDVPRSWRALIPNGYRIIAPSRFGYLGADMPPDPSVAAQAGVFAAFLDALDVERATVLGFSAGSSSCVQLALRHPDRVEALVLVAANAPQVKPVQLVPRILAPLLFSQPTLWSLRVFLRGACANRRRAARLSPERGRPAHARGHLRQLLPHELTERGLDF
jgi:pimeloyl-ACP methyl ester carboxylesterase